MPYDPSVLCQFGAHIFCNYARVGGLSNLFSLLVFIWTFISIGMLEWCVAGQQTFPNYNLSVVVMYISYFTTSSGPPQPSPPQKRTDFVCLRFFPGSHSQKESRAVLPQKIGKNSPNTAKLLNRPGFGGHSPIFRLISLIFLGEGETNRSRVNREVQTAS